MSALPPGLRRRVCSAVLVVAVVVLATACGRHAGPDVVVVGMEPGTRTDAVFLVWPQTVGLLCNHTDALRSVPNCRAEFDASSAEAILLNATTMLEADGTVSALCESSPEAMRAFFDLMVVTVGDETSTLSPGAPEAEFKFAQIIGVGAMLAVFEIQCPERFADAGDVARQVIIDYEL